LAARPSSDTESQGPKKERVL